MFSSGSISSRQLPILSLDLRWPVRLGGQGDNFPRQLIAEPPGKVAEPTGFCYRLLDLELIEFFPGPVQLDGQVNRLLAFQAVLQFQLFDLCGERRHIGRQRLPLDWRWRWIRGDGRPHFAGDARQLEAATIARHDERHAALAAGFLPIFQHRHHAGPIDPQLHMPAGVGIVQIQNPAKQAGLTGQRGDEFAGRDQQPAPFPPCEQRRQGAALQNIERCSPQRRDDMIQRPVIIATGVKWSSSDGETVPFRGQTKLGISPSSSSRLATKPASISAPTFRHLRSRLRY